MNIIKKQIYKFRLNETKLYRLYLYLKYKKEIRQLYNYGLKEGWISDDDPGWEEIVSYWQRSI